MAWTVDLLGASRVPYAAATDGVFLRAFAHGRSALLDWDYGREIVRLTMAAYLSAEEGRVVDLTDPATDARLATYVPAIQRGDGAAQLLGVVGRNRA